MGDAHMRYVLENSGYVVHDGDAWRVHSVFALLTDDEYDPFPASESLLAALSDCSLDEVRRAIDWLIEDGSLEIADPPYESGEAIEYRLLDPQVTDEETYPSPEREAEILRRYAALTRRQVDDVVISLVLAGLFLRRGELEAGEAALMDARHILDLAELTTLESITTREPQDLLIEYLALAEVKAVLLHRIDDWETARQQV